MSSKCSAVGIKSGKTPGAKAANASTLDIVSVRKLLPNKKLNIMNTLRTR